MSAKLLAAAALVVALGWKAAPQGTPAPMADSYSSLADAILALKRTETSLVRSLLDGHYHAARAYAQRGDATRAAAEMALFANEGDNAIGGVRKRLLEGGHHHHADAEAKGVYEAGYVVVTRAAKERGLALSAAMRRAGTDEERQQVWSEFQALAEPLLAGE